MAIKVRSNGQSLDDYVREAALFNSKANDLAEIEPAYYPGVNNGYPPDDIILNGLVLYAPLWQSKGSKFKTIDPYHHTCTATSPTWGLQGRTFSSGKYITIDAVPAVLQGNPAFTLEAWFNVSSLLNGGFIGWGNRANYQSTWIGVRNNTSLWYGGYNADYYYDIISLLNTWVHAVVTYDGKGPSGTMLLYINGAYIETRSITFTFNLGTTYFLIGRDVAGGNDLTGKVGEVRIYNRILTLAEIQHNYLVTRWRYA